MTTSKKKLKSSEISTKRLKYFYNRNKELYEVDLKKTDCEIGILISQIETLNKEFAEKISQHNKIKNVLAKLEYSEDVEKYFECLDEMSKPLEKVEFKKEILNNEIILGYLSNKLSLTDLILVQKILSRKDEEQND